jgi:flotillin
VDHLNSKNILDAEGIKKITELTANQNILANQIRNDEKKTITKQDVEAREAILELERQLAETEEKQHREVQSVKAREVAETKKIQEEQRLKSERARISSDEEIAIAEQNKDRQIIVAQKNKERTDAVETERVKKDQELEATERVKAVTLAGIEKDKAVEEEKKNIQFIIKERVVVEKAVVVEEEKIKDTREWAEADRMKKVAITGAEQVAEEKLITEVRAAESKRQTAELYAKEVVIRSEAEREASARKAEAMKLLAEGQVAEIAAPGLGEAKIQEAKAASMEKEGNAQAAIIERKGLAEASVIDRKGKAEASVIDTKGTAEAKIMHAKYHSEAEGIKEKADAMKILDTVGKDHEEFKLKLDKELQVDLAGIDMQRKLAEAQSEVIREGLKTARIDIVGGESTFFQQIAGAITKGKTWDRMVDNSKVLTDVKETFFNGDGEHFKSQMRRFVDQFAIGSEDIKNLTVAALISKMTDLADDHKDRSTLQSLFSTVEKLGIGGKKGHSLLG